MPRPKVRRKRKQKVSARRRAEKAIIWEMHKSPVGFKFYGSYKDGKDTKHFEFSVVEERQMDRRAMYYLVTETVKKMKKQKQLPHKHYYHTYNGFIRGLFGQEWEKTEGIVSYNVKHTAT